MPLSLVQTLFDLQTLLALSGNGLRSIGFHFDFVEQPLFHGSVLRRNELGFQGTDLLILSFPISLSFVQYFFDRPELLFRLSEPLLVKLQIRNAGFKLFLKFADFRVRLVARFLHP
jgi:hypothetical protein